MLRLLREKFKSGGPVRIVGMALLWAVIASFVLYIFVAWGMGRGGGFDGQSERDVAIEVDGRIVTRAEFLRRLRRLEELYRERLGEQAEMLLQSLNLRQQVLDDVVTQQVALREARRAGLGVSDAEVRDYILKSFVDEKGKFLGREQVERRVRRLGYSDKQFRDAVADDILYRKFQVAIEAGAVVTEAEIRAEYLRRNDKAKVEHVDLDPKLLGPAASAGEAELRAFYAGNRARFEKEERKARYVIFASRDQAAEPTEAELRKAYDDQARLGLYDEQRRARHILLKTDAAKDDPAKRGAIERRAKELADRARAGESFEALAREHSEDEGSAAQGGDLGLFGHGRMVKPFEEAVFSLKPGEVAGPVESQFGFHVIKLEEVKPARSFEEVRASLETSVRERKARTLAREAAAEAIRKHADRGDIQAVASTAGKPVQESPFLRDDTRAAPGLAGLEEAHVGAFVRALFAIPETGKLAPEPVPAGDAFVVLAYAEKRGPVLPPFEEVRSKVEEEVKAERGREAVAAKVAAIRAALASGKSLADAAREAGLEAKTAGPFARGGSIPGIPSSEAAAKAAFDLDLDRVSDPIELPQATLLLRVVERFELDPAKLEAEKEQLRGELERGKRSELFNAVVRAARRDLEANRRIRYVAHDLFRKEGEASEEEEEVL